MSTAVVATAFGGPEVLATIELPDVPVLPRQVRVRVRAAGVNPVDYKLYSGSYGDDPSSLPMPLGFEAAGEVLEVGSDARGPMGAISVGDSVIVYRTSGAYATELVVDAGLVLPKPEAQSFEQAAGTMLTGTTAIHALSATGVERGDTVLVHGASGGVGLLAAQTAVHDGARVIGTASERHHDALRGYGVVPVAYGEGLVDRVRAVLSEGDGQDRVDAAIDCVGTDEAVEASLALVGDRSRIATIAAFGRAQQDGIKALGGGPGADPGEEVRSAARVRLVELARDGHLDVVVARTFPLGQAAEAHRLLAEQHAGGKVVLTA